MKFFEGGLLKGLPQDYQKANESNLKAGELGCAGGYLLLGDSYSRGIGVEVDIRKAKHYWELAAMGGSILARHNLGSFEGKLGNQHRAMRHYMIAARADYNDSLDKVKAGFIDGHVTKDEYANALRACHERRIQMKSDARDKAAEIGVL